MRGDDKAGRRPIIYRMKTIDDVAEFHGHVCPGLALGYRVSVAALNALGERA